MTHVHDVRGLVEDFHVEFQDVEVEGGSQQASVPCPALAIAEQEAVPCGRETENQLRPQSGESQTPQERGRTVTLSAWGFIKHLPPSTGGFSEAEKGIFFVIVCF